MLGIRTVLLVLAYGEPWYSFDDAQRVHPWMQGRPFDVNGFTNAAMAWMPKSGLGAVVSLITMTHLFNIGVVWLF